MSYKETNPRKTSKLKKKNVRKRKKNKTGKIFSIIFFLILICSICVFLSLTLFFKIDNITVSGNTVYSVDDIIEKSGVKKGENLFLTTDKSVENTLNEKLPFVEGVKLKRILPDTLEICVIETVEKYCYQVNNEYYSASDSYKVLESYSQCPKGLILVKAKSINELKIGDTVGFSDEAEKQVFNKLVETLKLKNINITRIDTTNTLSLMVRVEERFDVNFGSLIDIENKIAHLEKMIKEIEEGKTGTINLSVWSPNKNESYFIQGNLQQ